jgi:hypothetical protein
MYVQIDHYVYLKKVFGELFKILFLIYLLFTQILCK